tara:strand:- start:488 stop:805 length:318 start_codon:yes stop_codon:yes gene_type:complete
MNFSEKQEKELIEILSNSFDNAQTFNEHKKQNKMKQRKQYETFIGDGYEIDFTLLLTDWHGDNETPGSREAEIIEATISQDGKSFTLPPAFIYTFVERKLLKIIQ